MSSHVEYHVGSAEQHILDAIKAIHYGAVEIVIHDSKIVQVEKREKVRFEPKSV